MDLSLLPNSMSEQGTGARFTVRSASSLTYSPTCRPAVRKYRAGSEEERKNAVEVSKRQILSKDKQKPFFTQTGTNGTSKEYHKVTGYQVQTGNQRSLDGQSERVATPDNRTSHKLNHNGNVDRTSMEPSGVNGSTSSGLRGRTEWRRHVLPQRSRSLDYKGRENSPDRITMTDMFILSSRQRGVLSKYAEVLDKRRTGDMDSRLMSSVKDYNSRPMDDSIQGNLSLGRMSQGLNKISRGHSFPSRLRVETKPGVGESAASIGSKGGQSIQDRIDKLYGSARFVQTEDSASMSHYKGSNMDSIISSVDSQSKNPPCDKAAGGTFPRHFSQRDNSPSQQSKKVFTWTPLTDSYKSIYSAASVKPVSPDPSGSKERTLGGHWQGQYQSRYVEDGGAQCGTGFLEVGTRSLDRARSKYTVAAQIRAARAAAGENTSNPQPHTFLEEESPVYVRDPCESKERASGSKDQDTVNQGEEKSVTNETNAKFRERNGCSALKMEWLKEQEPEKECGDRVKEENRKKETEPRSSISDDVFEASTPKVTLKKPSAANVRNKINQFEALSQRSQSLSTGQFQAHRRAFSMPTQVSTTQDGVKKSASAKAIGGFRDRWEGRRDGGQTCVRIEEKGAGGDGMIGSERALGTSDKAGEENKDRRKLQLRTASVDEAGPKLGDSDVVRKEGEETVPGDKNCDDFGKYSRLKQTLQLEFPLSGGTKRQNLTWIGIDEADFSKAPSPKTPSVREITANGAPSYSSSTPTGLFHPLEVSLEIPSPVSDEEKTPTNTPNSSPFRSQESLTECTPDFPNSVKESTPVSTPEAKPRAKLDFPHLPLPIATSSYSNLPDRISPEVNTPRLNMDKFQDGLDAWVASLNQKITSWSDDDDDDEGTEKDEDSNYDSDSAESSVTVTSNMSQDRRSFCVSLADLCNFAGVDYESENDSDELASSTHRSASLSSDISALSYVSVLPTEELDRLIEDVRGLGDSNLQDYDDVQVVVLHKEMGVGLGFSLAGGVDQNKPITVHRVFHSGVAAQQGSVNEGDQVLSINGTALSGYAHWEALRVLRRAKTREMGVVVLRRAEVKSVSKRGAGPDAQVLSQTEFPVTGQRLCVRLEKNTRDLGFSLEGGAGSSLGNKPLGVQKIFQGGPVDKMCPGDELLEIQGVNVVGMRRLEAWTLIRRLPAGPVDVVLHRPPKPLET
ncbi:uncharacterized protein LOC143003231 [Genypterus blacodes]|uniref:uncharacterized protein LOC143003231 n=1 Tax=Genypterus blacodes TaxID=154954 RepID=UPI003F76F0FF